MKYGLCEYGKGSSLRCRKPVTHRVFWTRNGQRLGEDRCEAHAIAHVALLAERGKDPEMRRLTVT